jgi:uncharacterized protein
MNGEMNLAVLISSMKPHLNRGEYVFCSVKNADIDMENTLFFFKEKEGITIVCTKEFADKKNYAYSSTFSWITLEIHSALEAVGLTAAFSCALADNNISCNVVAGFYHDHIFVPKDREMDALNALKRLAEKRDPSV